MVISIGKLELGCIVTLRLDSGTQNEHTQQAVFMGLNEDKDLAQFITAGPSGELTRWTAYRHSGRWAYGSSAGRIGVDKIISKF